MAPSTLSVVVSFFSFLVACVAAYLSWHNAQRTTALTARLKAQDVDYEKKRFFVELWDKMTAVYEIVPDDNGEYDENDVLDAANTMELVATCWENEIVDQRMVWLAFGKSYATRYHEMMQISRPLPNLRMTGPQILSDRPIIARVKEQLDQRFNDLVATPKAMRKAA